MSDITDFYRSLDLSTTPFSEAMRNNYEAEITAKCEQMRDALESVLNQLEVSQPTRDTMQLIREALATVKG